MPAALPARELSPAVGTGMGIPVGRGYRKPLRAYVSAGQTSYWVYR